MLRLQDYENIAKDIGEAFIASNGEQSINSLATKVASSAPLNPEGIRTVVRLANVVAFEKMFEKKGQERSSDRMINFELGDPEVVISTLTSQEEAKCKVASYTDNTYSRTVDLFSDIKRAPETVMEKTASNKITTKNARMHPVLIAYKHKLAAAKMREQKKQAEFSWNMALEKAAQCVMVDLKDVSERIDFEKNALACLGSDYCTEITAINMMTSPNQQICNLFGGEKVATVLNKYVGRDNPKHSRIIAFVKQAQAARVKYTALAEGIVKLEQASFGDIV